MIAKSEERSAHTGDDMDYIIGLSFSLMDGMFERRGVSEQ